MEDNELERTAGLVILGLLGLIFLFTVFGSI
jgi:hypothetical protein